MEVPHNQGARKSVVPGGATLDKKTLDKLLNQNISGSGKNPEALVDPLHRLSMRPSVRSASSDGIVPKTKYQIEKNSLKSSEQSVSPNIHQALLDSSCVFRARTAIPHGLLFDLHEEVYQIIEFLLEEYRKFAKGCMCGKCCMCSRSADDGEMEEMLGDAQEAFNFIAKYIGRDSEDADEQEHSTNRIYADAKLGISHEIDIPEDADEIRETV